MLDAMITLALDYLFSETVDDDPPDDLEEWYRRYRTESPETIFPYLVEDTGAIEKVFVIEKDGDAASLHAEEMRHEIRSYLPFVKPPGSQGAQIGPVIKRTYTKQKGASPSKKILNTTMNAFRDIAGSGQSWSSYFQEIVSILDAQNINVPDEGPIDWRAEGYDSMLECVVGKIGPMTGTVIVAVKDASGKWPGERQEYVRYLMDEKLAGERYLVGKTTPKENAVCPLCGGENVAIYSNALKGSGLNLLNMDRVGVFPNIDPGQAWKSYALCVECADLLYIYKNHVIKKGGPKKDKRPFVSKIAGENALVVPYSTASPNERQAMLNEVRSFIKSIPKDVESDEDLLLDILKEEKAVMNLTFLWADIGQNIENVSGIITDVPPSRLRELSRFNAEAEEWRHPLFPRVHLEGPRFDMRPNLSLKALYSLFYRPGGKKAQSANQSKRLFQLKRLIAESVYHGPPRFIPAEFFWREIMTTAQWWWLDAVTRGDAYGLLHEGKGKKGAYLTAAGWIRHLCWWLFYFKTLGVMKMEKDFIKPEMDSLKPYFGPESAIDTPQKAYAFLLGVLYGRLLIIQGARGINVGANALTWLKRLTLQGKDLPELYKKIRGKLLSYEAEKSAAIRELTEEIGKFALSINESRLNELSQTQTCYYLLLGQSMARAILKKAETDEDTSKEGVTQND